MIDSNDPDRLSLEAIVERLAAAWNGGDAAGFAAPFAADAQQVNIFGARLIGREEIRARHDEIFKSIFRGSTNVLHVLEARRLAPDVLLAQVSSAVDVPQGPLRGELRTVASLVLHRGRGGDWSIVLFHNTSQQPGPPINT